ncbi:hypothetical protein CYR32_19415 [Chimaeribacter coloradensis]|uniref:Uncharacterized protein n=1 Tax=Chimaeribacter coloradensis TaxID=2060068 RepID=A0A2N5DTV3_9GAMM|nr:hypothetical protein CYR32_19415 [Chimaeribacter coloradensis]
MALGLKVAQLSEQYQCRVAALPLNDAVGIVQELNNSRLQVVEARQAYNERQDIRHKHLISDAIEQYLAKLKEAVEETSRSRYEPTPSGYPAAGGKTIPKEQVAKENYARRLARLQKYYKEPERAAFAAEYRQKLQDYQQRIEAIGKDLAAWYSAQLWKIVIEHDYAPETCIPGWAAQLSTLTTCLQGGSTDEKTESVWYGWLTDPQSPAYKGLLGNQASILEAIYAGIGGYTNLKAVLGSKEISELIDSEGVRRAIAQRTLAISGAVSRLTSTLGQATLDGYSRVIEGVIYLTEKQKITVFTLSLSIEEYQQLNRDIARTQLTASAKPAQFGGMLQDGNQITHTASAGSQLQVTDPAILKRYVTVTLVSDMEPEKFIAALRQSGTSEAALKKRPLADIQKLNHFSELRISSVTLAEAANGESIKLAPGQVQHVIEDQLQLSRRLVSGNMLGGLLGAGMLYLQVGALAGNLNAVKTAVGDDIKAQLVLLSNMTMVASSAVETCGFIHMLVRKNPWALAPNVKGVAEYVHPLIRAGGVIAGVASIIDGIGMFVKAWDIYKSGDTSAAIWYSLAGTSTVVGGAIAAYAAYSCQFALFGLAGLAALLIVAGAVLAIEAANATSSAFEVWLRCGCFGVPEKRGDNDRVWKINNPDDLNEALIAYKVIVSGVTAEVSYQDIIGERGNDEDVVALRVRLPGCNSTQSAWDLKLVAQGSSDDNPLLISQYNLPGSTDAPLLADDASFLLRHPRHPWRTLNNTLTQNWDNNGLVLEGEAWVNSARYSRVTLEVNYWPDKADAQSRISLTLENED